MLSCAANDATVWALTNRKELHEFDAITLESRRVKTLAFEGLSCTFVQRTGEVWVGDKKGAVHVLSAETLEQTSEFNASQ